MKNRVYLNESEMPKRWYNIVADMPNKMMPPLHPGTKQPLSVDDLKPLFPEELFRQEVSTEKWIDIPEEVLEMFGSFRSTPLHRAYRLEKFLDTPAKIYFKNESVSPSGSHKTNTAIPQAYYNMKEGVKRITTETGAGQWGTALSYACQKFGIDLTVFMVKVSFDQKPYRKIMMNTFDANVVSSPSYLTASGRNILEQYPDSTGSLGIAISEAIEVAANDEGTKYALGSVLNHVLMHQTIIGLEAIKQMEIMEDYPDIIIAPFGGGSNFAGLSFPFLEQNINNGKSTRFIAVEPHSCPKLTRGKFMYDFGDTVGLTPLIPMYSLGHTFVPAGIHAGGLRYHGAGAIVSQLLKDGLIEAASVRQKECFEAGLLFAKTEGIIPAPETTHAIAKVINEAMKAKLEGKEKTILFNLSGHGHFDLSAYSQFLSGEMNDFEISDAEITKTQMESSVM